MVQLIKSKIDPQSLMKTEHSNSRSKERHNDTLVVNSSSCEGGLTHLCLVGTSVKATYTSFPL